MLKSSTYMDEYHRMDRVLTNIPPGAEQIDAMEALRPSLKAAAEAIVSLCPDGREKALALTKIEEATMWAIGSIARATAISEDPF